MYIDTEEISLDRDIQYQLYQRFKFGHSAVPTVVYSKTDCSH
jgi:hypothetical protein